MIELIIRLVILFTVIIDPPLSFIFFVANTKKMERREKLITAFKSILFAVAIAFTFLIFGNIILRIFSINLDHFQVAGGIILSILGIRMTLGMTFKDNIEEKNTNKDVLPTIIATPLISGPACITTILILSVEHGRLVTGISLGIVLFATALLLLIASLYNIKKIGTSGIKMMTTMLGLITLSWGISFILNGLGI